jgi:GntR family transcriptional regulator/MocR family aminotransferase
MQLHVDLEHAAGTTLRARVENALRDAIRSGLLAAGTRLPASRGLCVQLGVSRGVVVDAYAQLTAEGYLRARQGAGTTVAPGGGRTGAPALVLAPRPPTVRYDLSPFVPALDAFPRSAWRAALSRALRAAPDERLGLPDGAGTPELRRALASYLARSRGVRGSADQVIVCNGLRQGIGLLWSTLATTGARRIAVEHPGWPGMAQTAFDAGLEVVPVPVDAQGLVVERLAEHEGIDAVAVAPAHQYPSGAVMPPSRRAALVAWAQQREALIVEDDYDAQFRYDRQPIGPLQGLAPQRVAYGGSASKSLAPGLRLGWLVVPAQLVEPIAALQRRRGGMPAALEQLALGDVIERGELDRHLRRQRRRYRRQRDVLLQALDERLPEVEVKGAAAGLFVLLRLPAGASEAAVLRHARASGLALEGSGADEPAIVVGYGNLAEAAVAAAVEALAASVRAAL